MRVGGLDISDCLDCPLLAGLSDAQMLERIESDPMIRRCLTNRKKAMQQPAQARRKAPRCVELDNTQGLADIAG